MMVDEEKEKDLEDDETDESEKDDVEELEEKSDVHSDEQDADFEAEAELEEKRGKPDPLKAREAFKDRKDKRAAKEGEADDGDKPVTVRDLEEILNNDRQQRAKADSEREAATIAASLTKNPSERRAILAKWKNRTFPSDMPLQEQLEEMQAAVNHKKLLATANEAKRALKNKENASKDVAATHRDPPQAGEPKLSAADKVGYAGYVWDGTRRVYKKPIAGGKKHVFKDPKSKRTWVE